MQKSQACEVYRRWKQDWCAAILITDYSKSWATKLQECEHFQSTHYDIIKRDKNGDKDREVDTVWQLAQTISKELY